MSSDGVMERPLGRCNVYSELDRGTTFRLYLRPDPTLAEDADATPAEAGQLSGDGEHVLVVEDNERRRAVLVHQLGELGYRVSEAENATAALVLLAQSGEIDLLLTDVVMPGKLDGCGLAREFIARRPDGKVLLTSGFPGTRLAELDEFGASLRLLDKPYRKRDLARLLRDILAASAGAA